MTGFQIHGRIGSKHTNDNREQSHLSLLTGVRRKHISLRSGLTVSFALSVLPQGERRKSRDRQYLQLGTGLIFCSLGCQHQKKLFKKTPLSVLEKSLQSECSDLMGAWGDGVGLEMANIFCGENKSDSFCLYIYFFPLINQGSQLLLFLTSFPFPPKQDQVQKTINQPQK